MRAFWDLARSIVLVAAVAAVSLTSGPAIAQTLLNSYGIQFPPPPAVPFMVQKFGDISFVRDGTFRNGKYVGAVVFTSNNYPIVDLANGAFDPVDSLFIVCYSGGYVNPLVAASAAGVSIRNYTIAASTAWYQVNFNIDRLALAPPNKALLNFANSWRNGVVAAPRGGMEAYYTSAQQMSPFTPPVPPKLIPGGIGSINYSIYASPDAAAGRGPNNTRVLGNVNLGQPNQQRQFVILAQWNVPAIRFAANILRMYDLVTRVLMVPANHVVILYNNPAPAALGPIIGPIVDDPNGLLPPAMAGGPLRTAPVNGPNTRASWLNALGGKLFLNGNGQPIQPQAGDKLFIFHTGHGNTYSQKLGKVTVVPPGVEVDVSLDNQYDLNPTGDLTIDSSIADIAGDGVTLLQNLQFSFGQMLPPGTRLVLNGNDLGPLDIHFISDPSEALPIDPFITQPTYTYQLTVPQSLFTDPNKIVFQFTNSAFPTDPPLSSLIAYDISGGDQELLQQVVPGPDVAVTSGRSSVNAGTLTLPLVLSNTGGTTASNVTIDSVTAVSPATYVGPVLPVTVGNIGPGSTVSEDIQINVSGLKSGAVAHLQVNGSYQDGAGNNYQFSSVRGVKLP